MIKKLLVSFSLVLSVLGLASCDQYKIEESEEVDPNRTQLYVQNFKGGYGVDWLYAVKKRFEEYYKDTEFTEGKTGVQIMISDAKVDGISLRTSKIGRASCRERV